MTSASWPPDGGRAGGSQLHQGADDLSLVVATGLGVIRTRVELPRGPDGPLRVRSTFTPSEPVTLPDGPRDLVIHGEDGDPTQAAGVIQTCQRGPRSGMLFGSFVVPEPATFFYLQDFSASSRYFQESGSSPADRVGHEWPALGYSLPGSDSAQLRAAEEYVISDTFLCLVPEVPDGPVETARTYLDLFANVYLAMERPQPRVSRLAHRGSAARQRKRRWTALRATLRTMRVASAPAKRDCAAPSGR